MLRDVNGVFPIAFRAWSVLGWGNQVWTRTVRFNGNRGAQYQMLQWVLRDRRVSGARYQPTPI